MKKVLSLVAAAAILAAATAFAAPVSIVNSKHNLSTSAPTAYAQGSGTTQICVYCHTPHNAYTAAPLWNRNGSQYAPSSYTLYSGLNMANVSNKSGFTADSISLFCMSCHDGSNLNNIKNQPVDGSTLYNGPIVNAKAILTTNDPTHDMRSTHPINFEVKVGSETIQSDLKTVNTGNINGLPLFKSSRSATNTLECSSCHAVHDNQNAPFLRVTMNGSALCLACHAK